MKANNKVLIITFIINLFMALSLNSFSTSTLYLPMVFLYFLSGLAAFMDKISFYKDAKFKIEEKISWLCFCVCFLVVCFYIANSLGFIEVNFQCNNGTYKVLMQGIQNSFFTFNSINITPFIFIFAFMMPFAYLVLCIISYLREQGLTMQIILNISSNNKKALLKPLTLPILLGIVGMVICHFKYISTSHSYGRPQYHKYFLLAFMPCLCISYALYFLHHKNK